MNGCPESTVSRLINNQQGFPFQNLKKMASKATMVGGVIINATTFVGESYQEKYEEIKRHDLAVFLTKIAGALATGLAASQFSSKSTELLRRLPEVASALNREETRFAC